MPSRIAGSGSERNSESRPHSRSRSTTSSGLASSFVFTGPPTCRLRRFSSKCTSTKCVSAGLPIGRSENRCAPESRFPSWSRDGSCTPRQSCAASVTVPNYACPYGPRGYTPTGKCGYVRAADVVDLRTQNACFCRAGAARWPREDRVIVGRVGHALVVWRRRDPHIAWSERRQSGGRPGPPPPQERPRSPSTGARCGPVLISAPWMRFLSHRITSASCCRLYKSWTRRREGRSVQERVGRRGSDQPRFQDRLWECWGTTRS